MASIPSSSTEEFVRQSFDFLVIGGGTAGLAVASRLAQDGSFSVGVIEAGAGAQGKEEIDIPAYYERARGGAHDWQFATTPQAGLGGRSLPWPRGKILGGTSGINIMAWNRANREDYDAWESLGNQGWGWDHLLPFFKESETFHPPSQATQDQHQVPHDPTSFGQSGPIQVSYATDYSPTHRHWHQTLNALGVETNPAHVSGSNVGVWTCVNAVDPKTGRRSYATSYIAPRSRSAGNLHILTEAYAEEILLDTHNGEPVATGVRFTRHGESQVAKASREVILSAGSVQSPQMLELSGIGNPDVLSRAGVPLIVHSPCVGENLQDHLMLSIIFEVDPDQDSPADLKKDEKLMAAAREQYDREQAGRLTILPGSLCYVPLRDIMPTDSLASLASQAEQVPVLDAEKTVIQAERLNGASRLGQVEYICDLGNWNPNFPGEDGKKYGVVLQILQYPFSIGSIHIGERGQDGGKPTMQDKPIIDPAYYGGQHGRLDLEVMKQCMPFAQKIVSTSPMSSVFQRPAAPTSDVLSDPARLHKWVVDNTITDWHPVGTCSMGGRRGKAAGVVDDRLRVYGVKGLRVVDASVMPLQISAHIQSTIYAIAEKAAHMICQDNA